MTEPKNMYTFVGDEFDDQRLEISSNYHKWAGISHKIAPIYLEIVDGDGEYVDSTSIGFSTENARRIIAALTGIIDYLEAKND